MKILVFCPTAPRIEPEVVNAIFNQKGVEYFDVMFTRDNPYCYELREAMKNVQLNYEKMRRIVLSEGYQKVWVVESDTIPPEDALKKMLEVDAPVVSGIYAMRHGEYNSNIAGIGKNMPDVGMPVSWQEIFSSKNKTVEISGGCMGCLLIDRSVLEMTSFILENNNYAPDVPFMSFCWKNKIPQKARIDVLCGHKKPDGDIIWPDPKGEKGWRLN